VTCIHKGYPNRDVSQLKPLVNVVELEDAMSEVEGVHPEITGDRPCDGLRVDLKRCLLKSDCCLKSHKTPLQCLQDNEVPQECQALRVAFFECKRSLLDMRTRFRGRKGY